MKAGWLGLTGLSRPAVSAWRLQSTVTAPDPQPAPKRRPIRTWLALLRRPTVTFALGLVVGCVLMFTWTSDRPGRSPMTAPEPPFTVERTGNAQTYEGKVLQTLYPQIENPKMVVEKTRELSPPRRVLHGTLDNGKIQVLWNL